VKGGREGVTCDLLLKFWDSSISRVRLELETSNLACRLTTQGSNEKIANLEQRGSERGHLTYFSNFGTPSYLGNDWSYRNFKFGTQMTKGDNEKIQN